MGPSEHLLLLVAEQRCSDLSRSSSRPNLETVWASQEEGGLLQAKLGVAEQGLRHAFNRVPQFSAHHFILTWLFLPWSKFWKFSYQPGWLLVVRAKWKDTILSGVGLLLTWWWRQDYVPRPCWILWAGKGWLSFHHPASSGKPKEKGRKACWHKEVHHSLLFLKPALPRWDHSLMLKLQKQCKWQGCSLVPQTTYTVEIQKNLSFSSRKNLTSK